MELQPLFDKIIVAYEKQQEVKTASGIIMPAAIESKEKPKSSKVLAVGGGTPNEPMVVKVGDDILYNKQSGFIYEYKGDKYLFLTQRDVIAIV